MLSSPFYNINASKSSNYGSIGAVIAHFKFLVGSIIMELNLMKMVH
ncbi:M13-type metalloendopeptidase [Mycoplasmopsis felis]|nr:M13-type metalloendopeptidase [Mycoplasmopsis felis]